MVAAGTFEHLLGSLAFWRGVGKFIIDILLIFVLFYVVSAISGHPVHWPTWSFGGSRGEPRKQPESEAEGQEATHHPTPRRQSSERHLEMLDTLRTTFKYQASTVVLIVFAVLLLGIQRVLGATEIATILSGIAGFVLGQSKAAADGQSRADSGQHQPGS